MCPKHHLHGDDDRFIPLLGLRVAAVVHYHVHTLAHLRAKLIALDTTFLLACLGERHQEGAFVANYSNDDVGCVCLTCVFCVFM